MSDTKSRPQQPQSSSAPEGAGGEPLSSTTRDAILARGRAVLDSEIDAIGAARKHLGDEFVDAVNTLHQCRGRVCVTGIGKARLIGDKIQATMASTGTLAYSLHPVEALHGDLGMVHGDDVVLGLSKSGGSELSALLPLLKRLGCKVILLTGTLDSEAAKHADHLLNIGETAEACPLGLAPSSSTASMLALGDALALSVMELRAIDPAQYALYHPGGALGRSLMRAHELMRVGVDCPVIDDKASLGECYESILKAPRRAGAAAVVNQSNQLVGIVTHGDFFRLFKKRDLAAQLPVTEAMSRNPVHVKRDDMVIDVLEIMRKHAIDEIPVVDDGDRFVGMIDVQDLIARGFSVFDTR
jgi:arabinose-5-phosphate isomerase